MPTFVPTPSVIPSVGNKPKVIEEFIGGVNTRTSGTSVARMSSPQGWTEPGQRPDFEEYTLVLEGSLTVEFEGGVHTVNAGQAIIAHAGEWVRYSSPTTPAVYIAICSPAFSPERVHRDAE